MTLHETIQEVKGLNITDDENDLTFKAAVIILWACSNQTWNLKRIEWVTGYKKEDVYLICGNLRAGGFLDYEFYMEEPGNIIEFTCICMMAAGVLMIYNPDRQAEETPVKEPLKVEITEKAEKDEIYPLPNVFCRIIAHEEKSWVRPLKLEGEILTCSCQSAVSKFFEQGEILKCHVSQICQIEGKLKAFVTEVIKEIIAMNQWKEDSAETG